MPLGVPELLMERTGERPYQYNNDGQASRIPERYQPPDPESPMDFGVKLVKYQR